MMCFQNVLTPNSFKEAGSTSHSYPATPSAPTESDEDSPPSASQPENVSGARQVKVPAQEKIQYIPARQRQTLILGSEHGDFKIGNECLVSIKQQKKETLVMCCLKEHDCTKNPSIKVMIRESQEKPNEKGEFLHLR